MTKRWLLLAAVATFGTPAAAQVEQSVRGEPDHFGPGFTNLFEERVEFRLLRPGNVVLLWVKPRGEVDVYWPIRSGDRSERRAGRHGTDLLRGGSEALRRRRGGRLRGRMQGPGWNALGNVRELLLRAHRLLREVLHRELTLRSAGGIARSRPIRA